MTTRSAAAVILAATACELPRAVDWGVALHGQRIDAPAWTAVHAAGMVALTLTVAWQIHAQLSATFRTSGALRAVLTVNVALLAVASLVGVMPVMVAGATAATSPELRAVAGACAAASPFLVVIGAALAERAAQDAPGTHQEARSGAIALTDASAPTVAATAPQIASGAVATVTVNVEQAGPVDVASEVARLQSGGMGALDVARALRGRFSQRQIAAALGMHPSTLSRQLQEAP